MCMGERLCMIVERIINRWKRKKLFSSFNSIGSGLTIFGHPKFINPDKISIGNNVNINDGVLINATESEISIGNMVTLSANSMILAASYDVQRFIYSATQKRKHIYSKIEIKDNVWIGAGAIILPNVSIADHVVIGAGSVVTHSINESYVVVAGNPAKIIKRISKDENSEGI